jgi:predicted DNA-binding transcriptional regulator AlpA
MEPDLNQAEDEYITPEEVCVLARVTESSLAQRRYQGKEPRFYKPTPKVVLYKKSDVLKWIEDSAQTRTNRVA